MASHSSCIKKLLGLQDITSLNTYRAVLAEIWGTFLLVFLAVGTIAALENPDWTHNGPVQIGLCIGMAVTVAVWSIGHISGGHVNPAVTSAFLATGGISLYRAVLYVAGQLLGSLIATGLAKMLLVSKYSSYINVEACDLEKMNSVNASATKLTLGVTCMSAEVTVSQGILIEAIITAILVFTVFASVDKSRKDQFGCSAHMIGLSVVACHFFAIPVTGSSMNPARSFGPAVFSGIWTRHYVYWIGPILGGVVAALVYKFLFSFEWSPKALPVIGAIKNRKGCENTGNSKAAEDETKIELNNN